MSKKLTKCAFDFYVPHFNELERINGPTFKDQGTIVTASDNWRTMTLQQREPFEKMAANTKQKPVVRSTHLSEIMKKQQQMKHEATEIMKATIKVIVANSFINGTMAKQEYFFIDGNYFYVTSANNQYYPAEVALIKFTFENGIVDEFHTFVNPGKTPIGYSFDATYHSAKTHRLPVPPNAKGEKNFNLILQRIITFLGNPLKCPPLFTLEENIPMVESFMNAFSGENDVNPNSYRIYPIHQLMFDLKEQAIKRSIDSKPGFESIHIARAYLDSDKYLYVGKTACEYHEEIDCTAYCPLSTVKRWSYTLMDHLCVDLNISLTAGKHFPIQIDISHLNNTDVRDSKVNNTTASTETEISNMPIDFDRSSPERHWQIRTSTPITTLDDRNQKQDLSSTISTDFSLLDAIRSNGTYVMNYSSFQRYNTRARGRGRGRGRYHVPRIGFDDDKCEHAHDESNRSSSSGSGRKSTMYV